AVLPKDNSKSITVNGEDLSAAISRVAQFADERSRAVRIKLEKGELKLSASSTESGESEDSLETNYNGDALTVGFNAQYVLDFLKAVGAGEVKLELKDAQSAGQLRPANSEDYKYRYLVCRLLLEKKKKKKKQITSKAEKDRRDGTYLDDDVDRYEQ